MPRKKIPDNVQADVLFNNKRRCPLCFSYNFDYSIKKGQIAHLDKDSSNNSPDNLIFLCLDHHEEFDSKTSQSKGIKKEEILKADDELKEFLLKLVPNIDEQIVDINSINIENIKLSSVTDEHQISIEAYKIRLPIYYSYRKFISIILRDASFQLTDLYEYLDGIHEAPFLFNNEVNNYLQEFKTKSIQFRAAQKMLESKIKLSKSQHDKFKEIEEKLFMWLTENFEKMNSVFERHLKIRTS